MKIKGVEYPYTDSEGWPHKEEWSKIDIGDVMTIESFVECCKSGSFIDFDGHGKYAKMFVDRKGDEVIITAKEYNLIIVYPSDIKNGKIDKRFTHVVWFNK